MIYLQVMEERSVILFDGVCNLCNGAVQFVIRRDKNKNFAFASLQSDGGRQLLLEHGQLLNNAGSFVLIEHGQAYLRSEGALRVIKKLNFPWSLLYVFKIIPLFMRDFVYNLVAKNRYKWFGKQEMCMTPTPELKSRFLN